MPTTYEPIAATTFTTAASDFTFSSIPNTYTDLRLVLTAVTDVTTAALVYLRFNGDTGTNYSRQTLRSEGTIGSNRTTSQSVGIELNDTSLTTSLPTLITIDILSYANSTNKTCLIVSANAKNDTATQSVTNIIGMWSNTSAINSINIRTQFNQFGIDTRATLYGILKA